MKMIRTKKIIAIFFPFAIMLLACEMLFAQSVKKPFYNFKSYTTVDGLNCNAVNCVYKDSRGFLWIGSERGLQRYNGSSFINFRHLSLDSNSIASDDIRSVREDKEQNIWICLFNGITKFSYQNGKLTNYRYGIKDGNKVLFDEVTSFFEDSRGRQWIGTNSKGLFLFDKARNQFIHYPPAAYLGIKDHFIRISDVKENASGEIIFVVEDGFVIIDKSDKQLYQPIPKPADRQIIYLPCGRLMVPKAYPDEIWITSNFYGLYKYNRNSKQWAHFSSEGLLGSDLIRTILEWGGDEWLLGNSNLCFFNHRTGVFTKAFDREKVESVMDISRDNKNNIWIASHSQGLLLLNLSTQLFSFTQTVKGWTNGWPLYYDTGKKIIYSMPAYFSHKIYGLNPSNNFVSFDSIPFFVRHHKVVNSFIADDDVLYMAMWGGMWKYDLQTHYLDSIVYKAGSFNSQQANFFNVCKSAGKIYFGGGRSNNGPFMYDKATHVITDLSLVTERNANFICGSYSITFYNHVLYAGANCGENIYCYNETSGNKYTIPVPVNFINGNFAGIQSLCVDKKENLWCGTPNGIYILNIPSQKWIRHIGQQQGYFPASSSQLICDEDGAIWCNSIEGLYCFNTNNFLFKNYSVKDGLLTESDGGCIVALDGHQIVYSNIKDYDIGFGVINTKVVDSKSQTISISITNLKVSGDIFLPDTLVDNVQAVKFPPNQNAFSLSYAGVDVVNGKSLLYSYFLEHAEKHWHEADNEQSLSYVNLAPGKYTLHIKCKSRDERVIGTERLLYITMLPAWYQTWWFKLLITLGISFLLFFAFRYYFQQKIKKQQAALEKERALNEERNRIAADMHDDVGAGLSRIRYITASMKDKQDRDEDDIDKIVSLSDESVEKMNEIIWALNQGNQPLDELIYYTRSQCSEMLNNAGVAFEFELPENIPSKILSWEDCRNIYLLIKEAVNNAIKHASAKNISIRFEMNGHLIIHVKDDGIGFSEDELQRQGNGLLNYKKRVENLKGKYMLTSSRGNGTKLLFEIPLSIQ